MYRFLLAFAISFSCVLTVAAQQQDNIRKFPSPNTNRDSLPYKLKPVLPQFRIMLTDSSTIFNSVSIPEGRPIVLMLFSPVCEHCSEAMASLLKDMDRLKDIRFYLISTVQSMTAIRKFYNDLDLGKYKNIEAIGWDFDYFYMENYFTLSVPDFAVYDKNKKLIKLFEVEMSAQQLYDCTR